MGTPLSHGWQQLQGLKRDRSRQAGPTQDGPAGPGERSRAGRASWAPPGLQGQPQPGCLGCRRVQALHSPTEDVPALVSPLHMSLQIFLKASGLSPSHQPLPACQCSVFSGLAPAQELLCLAQTRLLHVRNQGITLTFVWVSLGGCRDLGDRATVGGPAGVSVLLAMVLVHSLGSRMKIHFIGPNHGEMTQLENMQPVGPSHAQSTCSAGGQP